jgi:hypothetical protein
MSNLLFKDLLGEDGDEAMRGFKKAHQQEVAKVERKMKFVKLVNRHFEKKLESRMASVALREEASRTKQFIAHEYSWRRRYKDIMSNRRLERKNKPY